MSHVVFVHGAFANTRSWFEVPAKLRALGGHSTAVVPLPRRIFASQSQLQDDYVATLESFVPEGRRAVLVGHSLGGFSISQFAAKHPDRVAGLIYVAAVLPSDGQTSASGIGATPSFLGTAGVFASNTALLSGLTVAAEPFFVPFQGSPAFDAQAKVYVHCTDDQVIHPDRQLAMIDAAQTVTTVHLDTDHFPQFFAPDALVGHLNTAIAGFGG